MTLRDDLAQVIHEKFNDARGRNGVNAFLLADLILASGLIRKISAEAWEEGALWAAVECDALRAALLEMADAARNCPSSKTVDEILSRAIDTKEESNEP